MLFPAAYLHQNCLFKERLMPLKLLLFLSIEPFFSWRFSQLKGKNSPLFFQKKNRKKESFLSSGRTSRYKGGAQRSLPLYRDRPETCLCFAFFVLAPELNLNCWLMVLARRGNRKRRLRLKRKGQAAMSEERTDCATGPGAARAVCEWSRGAWAGNWWVRQRRHKSCLRQGFGGFFVFRSDRVSGTKKMTKPQPPATSRRA